VGRPVDVIAQESHVLGNVHIAWAVLLAQFAEQTRKNSLLVLEHLVLQARPDVEEKTPGKKVESHGTNRGALAAVHASGSVERIGLFDFVDELRIDPSHGSYPFPVALEIPNTILTLVSSAIGFLISARIHSTVTANSAMSASMVVSISRSV
jgi:hypothetical protein